MTSAILRYDLARRALAEARSIDEVREWEDKAAAVREYARRSRNREMEIDAAEIRVRAQRRHGELLAEMKASGLLARGRRQISSADDNSHVTLADLDTTLNESSRAQRLAAIAPDAFERLAARCRQRLEDEPQAHAFDVLKERDGPINGARSVMGSRQEPDDSLDYFPTPPWATRALFTYVLPRAGVRKFGTVWEPACGEGHIAEVAAEFADAVVASDIHDYGYGEVRDFLVGQVPEPLADWIVTNPPFGDAALKFVERALFLASAGVAMFFRSQWAVEGVERYENLFKDRPPTICAFFVERVPLVKGRWDPDAATATAYCWLAWVRDAKPRPTFWIPPTCRESLSRPDDRDRFTAHPVVRAEHFPRHDPETGEIIDQELEAAGQAVAPIGKATSPDIVGDDERRKALMAGGSQPEDKPPLGGEGGTPRAAPEPAHNPGGDHEVDRKGRLPVGADDGNKRPSAPTPSELEIPAFLRRTA